MAIMTTVLATSSMVSVHRNGV